MAKVNGTNLVVVANGVCVAGSTSCTLNINQNLYDTSTKDDAGWATHGRGMRDWSVDVDSLYDPNGVYSAEELIDSIIGRLPVTIEFATEGTGNGGLKWSGSASLENTSLGGGLEEAATISGSFKGNGALVKGTVSAS
jgi:predicted secreted protein